VTPWTVAPGSSVPRILQAIILEWDSHSLLQGIFPTQRSRPRSPALQADSLPSEPPGKQRYPISLIMGHSYWSPLLLKGRTPGIPVKLWVPLSHDFFFFGQKMCKSDIAIVCGYLKSAPIYSTHYKEVTGDPKSHFDKPFQGYGVRYSL